MFEMLNAILGISTLKEIVIETINRKQQQKAQLEGRKIDKHQWINGTYFTKITTMNTLGNMDIIWQ